MFPKVAFPYVVSTSRLGCPRGGVEGCLGLGAVGCVVHVGCWLMVDGWVPKRVSFFWKHVISWGVAKQLSFI